jgi:hypothetical protein
MHLPEVEAAIRRLEPLEQGHLLVSALDAEVEGLGLWCAEAGRLESTGVETFRKVIASPISIYKLHSAIEDDLLLPL